MSVTKRVLSLDVEEIYWPTCRNDEGTPELKLVYGVQTCARMLSC